MNYRSAKELLEGPNVPDNFNSVAITLASPESIRSWSWGEVKNPETINYRTYKPERGGLFCERIFGPTKDWECSCGKYKRIKHKGVICDRCGVEVTLSKVRRERMGHIELAVPVSHIWFFKCTPSRLGLMMDITTSSLERVLYYEDYIVVEAGDTPLKHKQILSESEYREATEKFGMNSFAANTGAEAIRDVLASLDLERFMEQLEEAMHATRNKQTRKKLSKQMKLAEGFRSNGTRPEWMVLDVLPVIPPELRPLVPLEGGRFATSDLNDLYRRVINRNNRLKNLQQLKTPNVIIRNEKRMLQEAVDAVFDNGRHGRAVTGAGNRPLKSLSDMLRGKSGRFRQNLLGKRVDYSGRSVIVVGPELKLNQCGLPQKMALVLFEPFIIKRLKDMGVVHTVRGAKKMIERRTDQVWDVLEDVIKDKTVMLNRAPTLHRLSIQSFEPILVEGEAIQIHPLVCTAFNADFDGDQMSVHVPLSIEAQMESQMLMLSSNNVFSPSSGRSMMTPTQDIALGLYYLTDLSQEEKKRQRIVASSEEEAERNRRLPLFADAREVRLAHEDGAIGIHSMIRFKNPDFGQETIHGDNASKFIVTTTGRVFFNEIWPDKLGFVNKLMNKNMVGDLISDCYGVASHQRLVEALDALKAIGFEYATLAGVSIGLVDMIVPDEKKAILDATREQVEAVRNQYRKGVVTDGERHNKVLDIWTQATDEVADAMYRAIEINKGSNECNPVFMMVDSKARGSRQQIRQLCGIRGLMAKPSGEIIERPITSNFREGLSVLEYFVSTHGARKGLADTALKTADAGYLTRKLVDVAHDVIIVEHDCNTVNGIEVGAIMEGDEVLIPLSQRIAGRTALNDIADPVTGQVLVAAGEEIRESACREIEKRGVEFVKIRSVLTCESPRGLCMLCYGRDLTTGRQVDVGTAVGTIAAQSIGEPGTQLTLRTFHIGGTASSVFKQPEIASKKGGVVRHHDLRIVRNPSGNFVALNKNGVISVHDESGNEIERYTTAIGAQIFVEDGAPIKAGGLLAKWDPYSVPILAEQQGAIRFHDFIENVSIKREVDEATGSVGIVILENKQSLHPQIIIKSETTEDILGFYSIPTGARVMVEEGVAVHPGDLLARTPRKESKTRDIVGGLPRVAELFEARQPKEAAEIARIEGLVDFGENQRGRRCLIIRDEMTGGEEEHLIPMGKHIIVFKGDRVKKGQQLTDGPIVPQEILDVCGPQELQEYLVREVQQVYRLQGVEINDKHVEVIVRQMLRKVKITNPGDTEFLWGDQVMRQTFLAVNEAAKQEGKRPAEATPALLGITKASLSTESFISAASFQDTTRVLTEAATLGRVDELRGFKENVIMGHLIPGGTGFPMYRNIKLVPLADPIEEESSPVNTEVQSEAEKKLKDLLG